MAEIIYRMALVGMSSGEMAYALGIKTETLLAWDCQSIASACLRNGGVSKYDPAARSHVQSIHDLIRRGRSMRNIFAEAQTFMPEASLSRPVKESLQWLFDPPRHNRFDEWREDFYVITLRRPIELCQQRWLDGPPEPVLVYRMNTDFDVLRDFLNDWRIPKRERASVLLELGGSVHESLRRQRFWGDKTW